jgi:hypothetical protein
MLGVKFAGDKARALDLLQRAYRAREGCVVFVPFGPAFDALCADSKFHRLSLQAGTSSSASL